MSRDLERCVDVVSAFVYHREDDRYEELIKKKAKAEQTRFGHKPISETLGFMRKPVKGDDFMMDVQQIVVCVMAPDVSGARARTVVQKEETHGY